MLGPKSFKRNVCMLYFAPCWLGYGGLKACVIYAQADRVNLIGPQFMECQILP